MNPTIRVTKKVLDNFRQVEFVASVEYTLRFSAESLESLRDSGAPVRTVREGLVAKLYGELEDALIEISHGINYVASYSGGSERFLKSKELGDKIEVLLGKIQSLRECDESASGS